jgi:starch phosphorylase
VTATDPVCGMPVVDRDAIVMELDGKQLSFCSEFCRQQLIRHPAAYEIGVPPPTTAVAWSDRRIAYFSMEIALADELPTYAGGLGVLAGDSLRSCADLDVPIVGVTLVHRKGYFRQELRDDHQVEHAAPWWPERTLQPVFSQVKVEIEGRSVAVAAWRYDIVGSRGFVVPVLLLDTDVPDNDPDDRQLTDHLYGGDHRYRLAQEIVLGVGGVRMLEAIGCSGIATVHLNEGHAAFAPLEMLRRAAGTRGWDFQSVRARTVFTTHTPVAAGHDQFDWTLVRRVLGDVAPREILEMLGGRDRLNMTQLALDLSHYVNGVARRHREVSRELFPAYEIHQITNGVHSRTWTSASFKALFDHHMPGWRDDPLMLHDAIALPIDEVWNAHRQAKGALLDEIHHRTGDRLAEEVMTIGFARRATSYKRPGLVLRDPARLAAIAKQRPLQLVYAGKAHPHDDSGKADIAGVHAVAHQLARDLPIVYLEDHDLPLARLLVAGCDLWLNTPLRPLEASGTSGMKAAHNGVPSLSVLDGWWREGHIEGVTGWSIGGLDPAPSDRADIDDAADLYLKLEQLILPLFYDRRDAWVAIMRQCIALNASYFNSQRMVQQYLLHAYAVDAARARVSA